LVQNLDSLQWGHARLGGDTAHTTGEQGIVLLPTHAQCRLPGTGDVGLGANSDFGKKEKLKGGGAKGSERQRGNRAKSGKRGKTGREATKGKMAALSLYEVDAWKYVGAKK
jgi:hypothetical protein